MIDISSKVNVDNRIKNLIDYGNSANHRSLFVIHGPDLKDQVMIIHHLISKNLSDRPSILWCHEKDSETPRIYRKSIKKLEKKLKQSDCDVSAKNSFEMFLLSTKLKFCSFPETTNILGSTYGMCVIQDFSHLTPNVLCRVTETVIGGGCILILLPNVQSLRELFELKMVIHSKLKTASHSKLNPLFNRRFVQSLSWCRSCLVLNEELHISSELLSNPIRKISDENLKLEEENVEGLKKLVESLKDGEKPLPQLVKLCKTIDQAKALLKIIEVLSEKNGRATVSITSGRGRGKSVTLGLGVAAAVYFGLSNIFIVSPAPENLTSFFEYLIKGFDSLDYEDSKDYFIYQSTNPEFKNSVVRISLFSKHRQIVQYVCPSDFNQVSQAELVVIDEAASIPMVQVKQMFGPFNVLMASTVKGYEGTGRSLSLKLLGELRSQSVLHGATKTNAEESQASHCRPLHEITLDRSIRYNIADPVELWLHKLLCLDATDHSPPVDTCPPPDTCELYYINKEVLLSGHKDTEPFLSSLLSLLVASHYKNSPDDLQFLSDAPAHHLFALLPPCSNDRVSNLPSVLCIIQVCLEGNIPEHVSGPILNRGERPSGDLIPWSIANQFLMPSLTKYSGARIIRIATHPDYKSMGYGSQAIKLLLDFYKGRFLNLEDNEEQPSDSKVDAEQEEEESELITPYMPPSLPLMNKLNEITPHAELDYIGVSFGLTEPLYKFWKKLNFLPLYISQSTNKITGENNCIMLHPIGDDDDEENFKIPTWLKIPVSEFFNRFVVLLGGPLRGIRPQLAFKILSTSYPSEENQDLSWDEICTVVNNYDLQRLESYCKSLSDRHLVTDLFTPIAHLYFGQCFKNAQLSSTQAALLIGLGLQYYTIDEVARFLSLPIESCFGQLNRTMKRMHSSLCSLQEKEVTKHLPECVTKIEKFTPVQISLDQDLEQAAEDYEEKSKSNIYSSTLGNVSRFVIKGQQEEFDKAKDVVSIKSMKRASRMTAEELENELNEPKPKKTKTPKKVRRRNKIR